MRIRSWLLLGMCAVLAAVGGFIFWRYGRGILPAVRTPQHDIAQLLPRAPLAERTNPVPGEPVDLPLQTAEGVRIWLWADNLPGARVLLEDGLGNYWVSQTREGSISQLTVENGVVTGVQTVFRNLTNPHGLALHPDDPLLLYIAEENAISRVRLDGDRQLEKIADLPADGGHSTRTIGFGSDGRFYVSIGSSCNVCVESDQRRSKILSMQPDGSDVREVARGLRNAVFFTWSPFDGALWTTEMGRDLLGDDLPPDEINVVRRPGRDYGWPYCYGKNVRDVQFTDGTHIATCSEPDFVPSTVDIPAHSAPLGLAFVPATGWPEEWQHDLIVAYHGSWNRIVPTGYKLVRVKFNAQGVFEGIEDFITGWLQGGEVLGRPVDVHAGSDGALYVTDDRAGVIYKVHYDQR